jgi:FkbM family methyltransferase
MSNSKISKLLKFGYPGIKNIQGSFSQFGEDFFLRWQFDKNDGFFVDVGAFDPFYFSNTYYLYSLGWSGINIEPNPLQFERVKKYRSRDINLNIAISDKEEIVKFSTSGLFAGIYDENYHFKHLESKIIDVQARRLDNILKEHLPSGKEFDLISVDCEGHDINVLKSNNWDIYRPKVIAVEDHNKSAVSDVTEYVTSLGYDFTSWYRLTKFFVRRD